MSNSIIKVLSAILPVIVMIYVGVFLRKTQWISRKGIDDIKFLVSRIMLTVAVFHALATADYTGKTAILVVVLFIVELLTFACGFLIRPLFRADRAGYIPFLMSLYEGGMLAYPLYSNLCGTDALSKIALLDISGLLFGFSIWMGMLQQQEKGESISPKALIMSALHTPTFIGAVLGVTCGITGIMKWFLAQPVSSIYLGCEHIIVAPLNAMILLAVGYDIDFHPEKIKEVIKPVIWRLLIQSCAIAVVIFVIFRLYKGDLEFIMAEVIYMSVPTTFSMQTYIRNPEGCSYVSNTNSIYMIITIIAYAICAFIYHMA
ncbi:permease [Butyrivibrio sp. JL13D10]|uniref:permease n=1 Tax=Butyrivibrio sp. JL13D10 TaxID=3236815 RepID=UPI0038B69958